MNLLFDVGNSRIKWALAEGPDLHSLSSANHKDWSVAFREWQTQHYHSEAVYLASVAGPKWQNIIAQHLQIEVTTITSTKTCLGVRNVYQNPKKLGVDRWLSMIAAHQFYKSDLCVVGCGTATTIDVVRADGEHLGGLILPGISTAERMLVEATAEIRLEELPMHDERGLLADNTTLAVKHGIVHATVSLVEKVLKSQSHATNVILTGGAANNLLTLFEKPLFRPNLVLEGLNLVASKCY